MLNNQTIQIVTPETLLAEVAKMRGLNFRLAQMHCQVVGGKLIANYSFVNDGDYTMQVLRIESEDLHLTVPSIGELYAFSYTYENEMKDLFGVNVTGLSLDFKGNFYKLSAKTPMNSEINAESADVNGGEISGK